MDEKKIKIVSLTTTYPEAALSSRPKFVHVLNRELAKLGVDVKTITQHYKGALTDEEMDSVRIKRFKYLPEKYEIHSSAITDAATKSKFGFIKVIMMMTCFFFFTFFECLRERPDIFHGHWAFPSGYLAFIMSSIFRKKFIVTVHGNEVLLSKFGLLKKLVVYGLNKSLVVANSNFTKNIFVQMGIQDEKILRINVPPDFSENIPRDASLEKFRKKITEPSNKLILFYGRLIELKGAEYAIRSMLELGDLKVHLIIAGDGIQRKQLEDLSKSLGLEDKVTFFGGASKEDLGLLRGTSDVFVCPSIVDSRGDTEGSGLVIPEAMKAGLPVVASSVGGIVEIVKDEVNGLLVTQKDPTLIAQAVRRILCDDTLRQKIIQNSKETLREFTPEFIAKQYLDIFQVL